MATTNDIKWHCHASAHIWFATRWLTRDAVTIYISHRKNSNRGPPTNISSEVSHNLRVYPHKAEKARVALKASLNTSIIPSADLSFAISESTFNNTPKWLYKTQQASFVFTQPEIEFFSGRKPRCMSSGPFPGTNQGCTQALISIVISRGCKPILWQLPIFPPSSSHFTTALQNSLVYSFFEIGNVTEGLEKVDF